jgi:hypothetical protein
MTDPRVEKIVRFVLNSGGETANILVEGLLSELDAAKAEETKPCPICPPHERPGGDCGCDRCGGTGRVPSVEAKAEPTEDEVERVAKAIHEALHPGGSYEYLVRVGHEESVQRAARAALSALPPRDDLAAKPCKLCSHVLACSRCGEPVSRDYELGVCHGESPAVGGLGTLDEHDQAEPYHEANGLCSPPHSSKPVAQVSRLVGGPNDSGWYYHDEGCPDEGAVGPFETRDEAEAHAHCGGYRIEEQSDDLAERFIDFVRERLAKDEPFPATFKAIDDELDRLDAARKAKL